MSDIRIGNLKTAGAVRGECRKLYSMWRRGKLDKEEMLAGSRVLKTMVDITKDSDIEEKMAKLSEKMKEVLAHVHEATRA